MNRGLAFLCNPYHRGGIERWMVDMAGEWARQGGEAWFVVPRPRQPFVNGVDRPEVWPMVELQTDPNRPHLVTPSVGDEFEFGTERYRAHVYARAVAVHVPAGVPLITSDDPAAWRAASWVSGRNPMIAVMHGDWAGYEEMLRRYEPSITLIVGVSHRVTERARRVATRSGIKTATIPCGVRIPPASRRPSSNGEPLRLVWVGRMQEEAKRVSDLPKIADALRASGIRFEMTLIGDGEARDRLRAEIERARLETSVRLLPWSPPPIVHEILARSDVYVLPSNREGMPVAIMEALSHGCAIVASRVSGIEDYEHHSLADGCYWVYDVGDVDAAVRAVSAASRIEPERRAVRARALAEAAFSIERTVQQYRSLVRDLPPGYSMERGTIAAHPTLLRLMSFPVRLQRVLRLWTRGRYRRPEPAQRHHVPAA